MLRMRLLKEAYNEIKAKDPNTALSIYALRKMVLSGEIPHHKAGTRYLINMDTLEAYLANPPVQTVDDTMIMSGIHKIS
jgi:hypothetical protein